MPASTISDRASLNADTIQSQTSDEPQIAFRADASAAFDVAFAYGRYSQIELLKRLGVPGKWDSRSTECWDPVGSERSAEAGEFQEVGRVYRLDSGIPELEMRGREVGERRRSVRNDAIMAAVDKLDLPSPPSPDTLCNYAPASSSRRLWASTVSKRSVAQLVAEAELALTRKPPSVIDKTTLAPSGNSHDYWHVAPYSWANAAAEAGQSQHIFRDGERIAESQLGGEGSEKFDRTRLQELFDDSITLALAWRTTKRRRYITHLAKMIDRFFLQPATRMLPHLAYAQVRPGEEVGRGRGAIEFKDVFYFLDAVRIAESAGALTPWQSAEFRDWLREFNDWLGSSPQGRMQRTAVNNHGTYYDVTVVAIAEFLGDETAVRRALIRSMVRIGQQFTAGGEQPEELRRTLSQHYVYFNIQGWLYLLRAGLRWNVDLLGYRSPTGASVERGIRWAIEHSDDWQYPQQAEFDLVRKDQLVCEARSVGIEVDGPRVEGAQLPQRSNPYWAIRPYWNLDPYRPTVKE